ncbi:glutamate/Leucine/Phenylalanine/Valine dehydrogenase family protein [Ehrlichia chaffeensis str. Heartland]|uniref:NAD-glutamate dehydrogenase family protein n=1 Tax=Ehrlichia chaffeensis (strain ATCC CRL-10679 / Arkansas) TaxID=205920 RepID=Q2GG64_EHRCR|nr:NAD-glutamate dehydrogenase [Ehrlichia chaffeensis]ABD44603.1 NAD-glutamate dehydrogenase family protein [Ehrlichia chaffeensis str. Arkansas]AHX03829.1 glutamate/Leucine/Phenylalanine/Valine dehydrogenase family protein [Ehrlichia chaffeensis str. Heartland]AHX05446.1 glutamate/Leucine/Phenylalanine/Valine dehydrogenase family protein [Ehrlichia chaffeensis str. Jax]AHX06434.1 glutamate/Leucine/Phenylalanine/Valine dehydrogenase family protein [Ehrlichia chaffeensis str. Liberty]AHX07810.1
MLNNFNQKIIDSVLELIKQEDDCLFKSFVKQFYSFSYDSDITLDTNFFLFIARDLYQLIKIKRPRESKVKIFNIEEQDNETISNVTIIEIINDNLPFIIDSIIIAIKKHNASIYHYTNAVLNIERKEQHIHAISPAQSCLNDETSESIVYFIISNIDKESHKSLKHDIEKNLQLVGYCVNDWKSMLHHFDSALNVMKDLYDNSIEEEITFLEWLRKDNFIFLGYEEYIVDQHKLLINTKANLGLQKTNTSDESSKNLSNSTEHVYIIQSNILSTVHRHEYMICVGLRIFNQDNILVKEHCFYGFFASIISFQDANSIPLIRSKIKAVEKRAGFTKGGHSNKALIDILQRLSRDELFQFSEEELFEISIGILSLANNPKIKLFIIKGQSHSFVNCIIFIPKALASTELANKMSYILEQMLTGKVVNNQYNMLNEYNLVRLQFILKAQDKLFSDFSELEIEEKLIAASRRWEDKLQDVMCCNLGSINPFLQYLTAFPPSYQEYFNPKSAYHDIIKLEQVCKYNTSEADLYLIKNSVHYQLKIYIPQESNLQLSKILSIVKKMGTNIILHHSYTITAKITVYLHHFILSNTKQSFDHNSIKQQFETTIKKIFAKEIENDYFNSLVILANLHWKEVMLIRALSRYLKQVSFNYSQIYTQKVAIKYPKVLFNFIKLFEARFNPEMANDQESHAIENKINELLLEVTDVVHDHILRSIYALILAILRTNYYKDKDYLSIKLDSSKVPNIPLPCPFREIYVYSNLFEGIHLRGGKVARGGIRWSDRTEDFRTEILGLMKAQMTKNSVIVPVGSKGGFILKRAPKNAALLKSTAVECYKNFLRGILDITDNIIDDKYVTPNDIIKYDEYDPYLVVAADKGTATFSDYANEISEEYNFWLGDAFASGGSIGFDHKKMGITAKGAWVGAQRHFWLMDKDIYNEPFTVIGIGDMSGDVFGNGMLLSNKIHLIGAFNHNHIFIDPSPDPEKSFLERKRLFNLTSSSWEDYDKSCISKGGKIFNRNSKILDLTPEIKELFNISEDQIFPNELIKHLLKAEVDMIWNGGIGTYIKSSQESNAVVADKTNDALRINGSEVKAAMIIEGGNLGCTQLGRVEYAHNGGKINTDFTDNSGGVICSDFEINIKICLRLAMQNKYISLAERNKILDDIMHEVPSIVLESHNKLETKALMLECIQAKNRIEQHHRLLKYLEKIQVLNRDIEFLPSDEEITKMSAEMKGFTCPQIAILIAYTRTFIKNEIMLSNIFHHSSNLSSLYESQYLLSYFPQYIRDNFAQYIRQHPLKKEILATCIVNDIVNRMGCIFVNHIIENIGITVEDIIKIYVITTHIYNLYEIWKTLDELDSKVHINVYTSLIREVQKFIGQVTFWFLRNSSKITNIDTKLDELSSQISSLEENIESILCNESLEIYNNTLSSLSEHNIEESITKKIIKLKFLTVSLDIIHLTNSSNLPLLTVGKIYFQLRSLLNFSRIRDLAAHMESNSSYWQRIAIRNLLDDLNDYQFIITESILKQVEPTLSLAVKLDKVHSIINDIIQSWYIKNQEKLNRYYNFLNEINTTQLDLSKLMLIIKSLDMFIN